MSLGRRFVIGVHEGRAAEGGPTTHQYSDLELSLFLEGDTNPNVESRGSRTQIAHCLADVLQSLFMRANEWLCSFWFKNCLNDDRRTNRNTAFRASMLMRDREPGVRARQPRVRDEQPLLQGGPRARVGDVRGLDRSDYSGRAADRHAGASAGPGAQRRRHDVGLGRSESVCPR